MYAYAGSDDDAGLTRFVDDMYSCVELDDVVDKETVCQVKIQHLLWESLFVSENLTINFATKRNSHYSNATFKIVLKIFPLDQSREIYR